VNREVSHSLHPILRILRIVRSTSLGRQLAGHRSRYLNSIEPRRTSLRNDRGGPWWPAARTGQAGLIHPTTVKVAIKSATCDVDPRLFLSGRPATLGAFFIGFLSEKPADSHLPFEGSPTRRANPDLQRQSRATYAVRLRPEDRVWQVPSYQCCVPGEPAKGCTEIQATPGR
jgi:hypothetical protein